MVSDHKLKEAREWVGQHASGFTHKELTDEKELTGGHRKTADRLLKQLLYENVIERAYRIVGGRLQEYYRPFKVTYEDVLRMRASRNAGAARHLASVESPSQPPNPESLEKKRRILEAPWHPTHEGAKHPHSANECPAPEKYRRTGLSQEV